MSGPEREGLCASLLQITTLLAVHVTASKVICMQIVAFMYSTLQDFTNHFASFY